MTKIERPTGASSYGKPAYGVMHVDVQCRFMETSKSVLDATGVLVSVDATATFGVDVDIRPEDRIELAVVGNSSFTVLKVDKGSSVVGSPGRSVVFLRKRQI